MFLWCRKIMKKLNSLIGESPEEGENLAPECGLHVPLASEKDKLKKKQKSCHEKSRQSIRSGANVHFISFLNVVRPKCALRTRWI